MTRTHHFVAGPHRTWSGSRICADCGQPEWFRGHEVAEVPEEVKVAEARRMGEVE